MIRLQGSGPFIAREKQHICFQYQPENSRKPGSCLWLFFDIRQNAGFPQVGDPGQRNYFECIASSGSPIFCEVYNTRTLDFLPDLPEFFYCCRIGFPEGLAEGDNVLIKLGELAGWSLPEQPIHKFSFWFLESDEGSDTFYPSGYRTYRRFSTEKPEELIDRIVEIPIVIEGEYQEHHPSTYQPTPGILWGDIHGMAFNQRPLDDYYRYAREVSQFDFAAAMLFSYNTCMPGVWEEIKDAAARWTDPDHFLGIVGFEAATVPDGSHRNAYFFESEGVPPIFCEDRPPAQEDRYLKRLATDTVRCNSIEEYEKIVKTYKGIITGHFHTLDYRNEVLAEIWQKQVPDSGDEAHIFDLLNQGFKFGIVGGSDTHDSMPGNPNPEPYCPQPAGFMAVYADQISPIAVKEAILRRQVYATSGARIILNFTASKMPMGSVLDNKKSRRFNVLVKGTGRLKSVELIGNGEVVAEYHSNERVFETVIERANPIDQPNEWYMLKVTQSDDHRAWSSPIWFE